MKKNVVTHMHETANAVSNFFSSIVCRKIILLLLITSALFPLKTFAQTGNGSYSNPFILSDPSGWYQSYNIANYTDKDCWFKLTMAGHKLRAAFAESGTAWVTKLKLFHEVSGNRILLDSTTKSQGDTSAYLEILDTSLVSQDHYYLKLEQNTSHNVTGTLTYISDKATTFTQDCTGDGCTLVGNGQFVTTGALIGPFGVAANAFCVGGGQVPCWLCAFGSPDIGSIPASPLGNNWAQMWHCNTNQAGEGIMYPFGTPLVAGTNYILSFWRRAVWFAWTGCPPASVQLDQYDVRFGNPLVLPIPQCANVGLPLWVNGPSMSTVHTEFNVPANSVWQHVIVCFQLPFAATLMEINPLMTNSNGSALLHVADFELIQRPAAINYYNSCQDSFGIPCTITDPAATYTWTDPNGNVVGTGTSLNIAGLPHNVTYTLTWFLDQDVVSWFPVANPCVWSFTWQPNPNEVIADAGPDITICLGQTGHIGSLGMAGCSWSPATWLSNSGQCIPTVTPTVLGSYTYTLTTVDPITHCATHDDVIVHVVPPLAPPIISGPLSACTTHDPTWSISSFYDNYNPTYTVHINGFPLNTTITGSGTSYHAPNPPEDFNPSGGSITWTITDPVTGCTASATFYVHQCCCPGNGASEEGCPEYDKILTTNYGTSGSMLPPIYFNGVIQIASNITLTNVDIKFGPFARIEIQPGATLTITGDGTSTNHSILEAGCDTMWDRIQIDGPTAKLITNNLTEIRDAINGGDSEDGGHFDVSNTNFVNNYKSFEVNGNSYLGNLTGQCTFKLTTFTNTNNTGGYQLTKPPYAGVPSELGIEINRVNGIQIGDETLLANQNLFTRMQHGMIINNSKVNVYNNKFDYIKDMSGLVIKGGCAAGGIGICISGSNPYPSNIHIGSTGSPGVYQNIFTNDGYGVFADGQINMWVNNNKFDQISNDGVYMQNDNAVQFPFPTSYAVDVSYNNAGGSGFSNFGRGFHLKDCAGITVTVNNNVFSYGVYPANVTSTKNTAVMAEEPLLTSLSFTCSLNTITDVKTGVWLTNLQGGTFIGSTNVNVFSNTINYSYITIPLPGGAHQGVKVEGCNGATVQDNNITHDLGVGGAPVVGMCYTPVIGNNFYGENVWYGVEVEKSPLTNVKHNTITGLGHGTFFYGNCNSSQIECNILDNYFYGCSFYGNYLNAATPNLGSSPGNQQNALVASSITSGNSWTNGATGGYRLEGVVTPIIRWWYVTGLGQYDPNVGGVAAIFGLFGGQASITPTTGHWNLDCGVGIGKIIGEEEDTVQYRKQVFKDIVKDDIDYGVNNENYQYADEQFAYRNLLNDSLVTLGSLDDHLYEDFVDTASQSSIGVIEKVSNAVFADHIDSALLLNQQITSANIKDQNRKTVNDIYLNGKLSGSGYSSNDSLVLLNIANQDPSNGGDAVITARVMLEMEPGSTPIVKDGKTLVPVIVFGNIYPNPSNGEMQMDYTILESDKAQLSIYDIVGNLICSFPLPSTGNHFSFTCNNFESGIYLCKVNLNNEDVRTDKIVLIK